MTAMRPSRPAPLLPLTPEGRAVGESVFDDGVAIGPATMGASSKGAGALHRSRAYNYTVRGHRGLQRWGQEREHDAC